MGYISYLQKKILFHFLLGYPKERKYEYKYLPDKTSIKTEKYQMKSILKDRYFSKKSYYG